MCFMSIWWQLVVVLSIDLSTGAFERHALLRAFVGIFT